MRVLVLERDSLLLEWAAVQLRSRGYQPVCASAEQVDAAAHEIRLGEYEGWAEVRCSGDERHVVVHCAQTAK